MAESDQISGDQARDGPGEGTVLPLAEAAARLGLSRDALRMRIRRGKAEGFKRGGQIFVRLEGTDLENTGTGTASRAAGPQATPGEAPDATRRDRAAGTAWPRLVEQQRQEIARLIQETERLNARLERHLEEAREMRQMLQREQVLRQQELALHRDVQALLRRLVGEPGLAGVLGGTSSGTPEAMAAAVEAPGENQEESQGGNQVVNQDLAEMMKEIGQSLRELEARDPPERG